MKKFIVCVTALFIIGCTQPSTNDIPHLKELLEKPFQTNTQVTQQGNITQINTVDETEAEINRIIITSTDPLLTTWLEENLANYAPKYLYALALRKAHTKAPIEETLFWQLAADLRSRADGSLCKDKYVMQYATVLAMEYAPLDHYSQKEKQKLLTSDPASIMRKVVAWDKQHPQLYPPTWFCQSGHEVNTSATFPNAEWEQRRKAFKKKYTASAFK